MESIDILGYFAGSLVVLSLLPQVIHSWRTKSAEDLSLSRYIIYTIGLILWVTYAVLINNGPVAVMNALGLVLATMILYLRIKYGNQ
jgi:MtN3 and saliva related transmembrane protein